MAVLTFDIEDWFHLLDHPDTADSDRWDEFPSRLQLGVERILTMLDDEKVKATFFCLGWVAEKYPLIIKEISDNGHQIGCHSYYHQLAYKQTREEFRSDTVRAKALLEDVIGKEILAYRIPGFSLVDSNLWVLDELVAAGFEFDCSMFCAPRGHGGLQRVDINRPCRIRTPSGGYIKEVPLNTVKVLGRSMVFSGGGYFRLAPVSLLQLLFKHHEEYTMTYFHPRDFDPDQPVLPNLSLYRRFKSYYGLARAENKFRQISKQTGFESLEEFVSKLHWDSLELVDLT